MARQARLVIPGAAHCALLLSSAGDVFRSDEDCLFFLDSLEACARASGTRVLAYSLLPAEARLVLVPGDAAGLGRCLQETSRRFVRWFNARYSHQGTVWRGRFRSCPVSPGLEASACRYVERLPADRGYAPAPWRYLWSSAAARAGLRGDGLLSPLGAPEGAGLAEPGSASAWRELLAQPLPGGFAEAIELAASRGRLFSPPEG